MIYKYEIKGSWSKNILGNDKAVTTTVKELTDMYPHLNLEVVKVSKFKLHNEEE